MPKDATNYFGVFLACKRFPSIVLDNFLLVELHDEPDIYGLLAATSLEGCLPIAMGVNCVDPDNEQWASQQRSFKCELFHAKRIRVKAHT